MATRSKKTRSTKQSVQTGASTPDTSKPDTGGTPVIPDSQQGQDSQAQAAQPAQPAQPAQSQDEAVQPMKKGIYLSALIYVEGMQAPADDFASFAKSAVTGAVAGNHGGATITVKNLHVENNVEDTGDSSTQADQTDSSSKGGFEF